jgi:hypothetical protein
VKASTRETWTRLWTGLGALTVCCAVAGLVALVWLNPMDWLPMWANWIWRGVALLCFSYAIGTYLAQPAWSNDPLPDTLEDEGEQPWS